MKIAKAVKIIEPRPAVQAARQEEADRTAALYYADELLLRTVAGHRVFRLALRSGVAVEVPVSAIDELAEATVAQLKKVEITQLGGAISQRDLDIDISVPGLIREIFGIDLQQRRAGQARSEAKTAAARANGAKGGRPPKNRVLEPA